MTKDELRRKVAPIVIRKTLTEAAMMGRTSKLDASREKPGRAKSEERPLQQELFRLSHDDR
jgi:hypothetical protein